MDAHDFLITSLGHLSRAFVDELFVGSMKCILRCTNPNRNFESIKEESLTALTLRFPSKECKWMLMISANYERFWSHDIFL